jgi:hypothetical protein
MLVTILSHLSLVLARVFVVVNVDMYGTKTLSAGSIL